MVLEHNEGFYEKINNFPKDELIEEQIKLSKKISTEWEEKEIKLVAGCDQAYTEGKITSTIVVLNYETLKLIETKTVKIDETIKHKREFEGYRESPAIIEAYNKLENKPDILMCDMEGIMHPRNFGGASHIGLILNIPTIGVTKKLNYGIIMGKDIQIRMKKVGRRIFTREHANPIYLSPGHKISLDKAEEIVKKMLKYPHKMPEPIHYAKKYLRKNSTTNN
jgi:deoxyribonuclease V